MRKFGDSESKYLKSSDLERDGHPGTYHEARVTISHMTVEKLKDPRGNEDEKYILYFHGRQKGIALNQTNENILIEAYGLPSSRSDVGALSQHFRDKPIVIWVDPNVEAFGEIKPGLRLRVPNEFDQGQHPQQQHAPSAPPAPEHEPPPHTDGDEPINF